MRAALQRGVQIISGEVEAGFFIDCSRNAPQHLRTKNIFTPDLITLSTEANHSIRTHPPRIHPACQTSYENEDPVGTSDLANFVWAFFAFFAARISSSQCIVE